MFLTEKQLEERLNSEKNLANRFHNVIERDIFLPGKKGPNVSKEIRTEIAIRSRLGEGQKVLAQEFNLTQGNVQKIESGKTKGIDEEKVEHAITQVRDR